MAQRLTTFTGSTTSKKKRQSWDSKPSQSQIQKNIAPNSFTIFSVLFNRHKKRINHSMAHTGYLFYDIDSHPDVGNFGDWTPNRNWVTMRDSHTGSTRCQGRRRGPGTFYTFEWHIRSKVFCLLFFGGDVNTSEEQTKVACKNAVSIFLRGGTLAWRLPAPF